MQITRCRSLVQGLFAPPGFSWRAASGVSDTACAGYVPKTEAPADGESLLAYWKGLLDERQRGTKALQDEDVRQLLHTALKLRQGKAQSSVPEQLLAVFQQYFCQLERPERLTLFRTLSTAFGVQPHEVDAAVAAWQHLQGRRRQQQQLDAGPGAGSNPSPEQLLKAAPQLAAAATPLYTRLFVPMSQQPGGIKFLADMRAELLQCIHDQPSGAAPLRALSDALRACLAEWFSVGLLQLQRISWEGSSAELLEKIAAGEAVHEFSGWRDLKSRLNPENRRVYAFFHNAMPGEPLVVLHTALTHQVATSMRQLLPTLHSSSGPGHGSSNLRAAVPSERTWQDQPHPSALASGLHAEQGPHASQQPPFWQAGRQDAPPSVAVFYSISATQRGLTGIDLGNFLIKQVAHCVQSEFPSVTTLCTLSPLPGFADWLTLQLARVSQGPPPAAQLLLPNEAAQLEAVAAGHLQTTWKQPRQPDNKNSASSSSSSSDQAVQQQQERAAELLSWATADNAWLHSSRLEAALQRPMLRLAAHYLLRERRRGLALDPVANFHLRNGAAVLQLNWRADVSPAGMSRSHGIMVNYQYDLDRLHDNNRAYLVDGCVAAAPAVEALLRADT